MCVGTDSMEATRDDLPTRLDTSLTSDMSCCAAHRVLGLPLKY